MMNLSTAFSESDVFSIWINSVTYNFTGDLGLTLLISLIALVVLMSIFKLPDNFMVILLIAPLVLFSVIDGVGDTFNVIIGVGILYLALLLWSLWPGK